MKKILLKSAVCIGIFASLTGISAHAAPSVELNGKAIEFTDQEPVIIDNRTLIPVRDVLEAMGAEVDWLAEERAVVAMRDMNTVIIRINDSNIISNGVPAAIDVPAQIINSRTMLPARAVVEALGGSVDWDGAAQKVIITTPQTEHGGNISYINDSTVLTDGTVVTLRAGYPVFSGSENGISTVNEDCKNRAQSFIDMLKENLANEDSLDPLESTSKYNCLVYDCSVVFDKFNMVSVLDQAQYFCGTQSTTLSFDISNYSLASGNELTLEDVLNVPQDEIEALSMYSFFMSDDTLVLALTSDTAFYSQYGYESMIPLKYSFTPEYFKINMLTGEKEDKEPVSIFQNDSNLPNDLEVTEYESIAQLSSALGFKMPEFSNSVIYIAQNYRKLGDTLGEIIYQSDDSDRYVLRKMPGDANISGIDGGEEIENYLYNGSLVYIYRTENSIFTEFSIEKSDTVYSYSVISYQGNEYELKELTNDIIDKENR